MRQSTAPTALSIKIVTASILAITAGFLLAAFFYNILLLPGLLFGLITLACYLRAPVAFDLSMRRLTVIYRLGAKQFGPVVKVSRVVDPPSMGIRLWGNGGLFAGTGIFWNKQYGIFRAYVTRAAPSDLILVETPDRKVIISPEKPAEFVEGAHAT